MKALLRSKFLWTLVLVSALVAELIAIMPKPIDMDLTKIGNGKNAVVFVYDPNLVASIEQSAQIDSARELLGEQVNFLIAKAGEPDGEAFKRRFQAGSLDVLFFNRDGELVDRQFAVLSAEVLSKKLTSIR